MKIFECEFPDLLLKVGKKEHLKDICHGKIYMNESGYFRKLEDNYRGDRFDGKCPINLKAEGATSFCMFDPDKPDEKVKIPIEAITDFMTGFKGDDKIPLFCCSQVNETIMNKVSDKEWMLKEEFVSQMEQFGEYYLVLNKQDLLNGIYEHIQKIGAEFGQGNVSYEDISSAYRASILIDNGRNHFEAFLKKTLAINGRMNGV